MNEQNTGNQNQQQGGNGVIAPSNLNTNNNQVIGNNVQQGIEPLPTPTVSQPQVVQQPVQQPVNQEAPVSQPAQVNPQPQPVQVTQPVASQEPVQPTQPVPPVQQVTPVAPIQQQVPVGQVQPTQSVTPTPVAQPQVVQQPVATTTQPVVEQQNVIPTPVNVVNPQTQDINSQVPTPPIQPTPQVPSGGMYGPSVPIDLGTDATQVGFVASSSTIPKKKNKPLIIGIIVVVLVALGLLGYFFIYPLIVRTFFSEPINVYETSINHFYKGITDTTNQIVHSKAIYDISLTLDSNIEDLKSFAGYTYGVNFGVDPDKESLQMGFRLKNNEKDKDYYYNEYLKNGKKYLNYSTRPGYIYNGEIDLEEKTNLFVTYKELLDKSRELSSEDIEYLVNKLSTLTIGSINKDKLYNQDTTLNINEKVTKVTNNKYDIDKDLLNSMIKYIIEGLKDDDKAVEILSKYLDMEDKDTKDALDKVIDSSSKMEIDKDLIYTINIYTYGNKNEIIGFGITTSNQSFELQYYSLNGYIETHVKSVVEDSITGKTNENNIDITGRNESGKTSVSVKVNDSEILTFVVTSWTDTKKELSYNLKYEEYKFTGRISSNTDINDKRLKYNLYFEVNKNDEFIKATLSIDEDWDSDVSYINTDNAVTLSDNELELEQQKFISDLVDTPFGEFFKTSGNDINTDIIDHYGDIEEPDNDIF
ncbi:MAG TPA: hypothetical protein DCE23_08720 [Firmicutes bacterium]|nr:hypothetical protein [Bacillota bacterium]